MSRQLTEVKFVILCMHGLYDALMTFGLSSQCTSQCAPASTAVSPNVICTSWKAEMKIGKNPGKATKARWVRKLGGLLPAACSKAHALLVWLEII